MEATMRQHSNQSSVGRRMTTAVTMCPLKAGLFRAGPVLIVNSSNLAHSTARSKLRSITSALCATLATHAFGGSPTAPCFLLHRPIGCLLQDMQASFQCLRSASGLLRPRQAPVPTKSTGCVQSSPSCYTRTPAPTWSVGSGQQRCQRSLQHAAVSSPSAVSVDGSEEDMVCLPGSTTVDNEAHPNYTVVTMEGADYPGLLRVIAWVINGLGLIVHSAVLKSDADKQAADVFWVTDMKGRKLSDKFATGLAERLQDYVNYCQPAISGEEPQEYSCGNIEVSNSVHPKFTQVTITAEAHSPGLLLELASVITGQQVTICEAVIRSHGDNPIASSQTILEQPSPPPGKRVLRFWVVESKSKDKLDFSSISALVYTMRLVLGHGRVSTLPPGSDITFGGCGCASEGNNRTPSAMSSFETS